MSNFLAIIFAMGIIYIPFSGDIEEHLCKKSKEIINKFNKLKDIINKFNKYRLILFTYFVVESVQQYLLFYTEIHNVFIQYIFVMLSLSMWAYLFSKFRKMKIDDRVLLLILGAYQIAIYITAVSLEQLNIEIKLLFNFIYVAMPTFVIFELSKPKK